ncbi:hypothetical protein [Legionella micdadei]|uniref:Uncharacterized protein n=1 Tax=Legionella micdadei TaxID=451 RepID=A0A1G5E2J8_LEGMI|nr:hypothetical protein [Legionella micdadei]KTD26577.1 hypothetical protein Lmic_2671 [Legionella micdadei]NSL17832.1 hypothetical protein [Legionella micdadei]SCY20970.1 hypothetical protein SAMN02982997_01081 [Legionella micdadei]
MKRIVLLSSLLFSLGSWAAQAVVSPSSPSVHHHKRNASSHNHHHEHQAVTVPVTPHHHGHQFAVPNTTRKPAYVKKTKPSHQSNRADLHAHGHD